jgi:maltose alpha-D-glucosyltransferase / alpha-amylase
VIKDLWYKNAVIYCVNVATFLDSNGDGIGDFEGLVRRLDYIAGLGATCIWLHPFQKSPRRDDGYDISDYGMRVLIDLVVNHTSDQHPWFKEARKNPGSKYRDYYLWSKKRPKDHDQGMVFPGVQKTTWTFDSVAKAYYFHRFYDFQPDLDTSNPAVQAEIRKIMGFWLQLGVSGFRMDAIPFVIESKGAELARHPRQYGMLRDIREFLQWRRGDAVILAEANVLPDDDLHYFGQDGDRAHMMFNFQVNQNLFYALAAADVRPLAKALHATRPRPASGQWGLFLRNHDELDLGRLTERQRERVFAQFGPDKEMQLYHRGIRRRLAPMLSGDRRRLELAYSLLFSLPGTPVMRYGDELGMGDDLTLPERNCARTPMQWSSEPHGGFSRARKTILPVISGGPYGFEKVNVAGQRRDPQSFLNWTERMIRLRKEVPEIGWGDFEVIDTKNDGVLCLRYDWRNNGVVLVHNFREEAVQVEFSLGNDHGKTLVNLLTGDHSEANRRGRHRMVMEPYGYHWYRMGGLGYLHERETV